ncbi:ABC transporter substrate-binding protein [Arthrobacter sp. ZGTC412]|uniref:ABC transporter substrate-binding protein n=1 Tax=Arthrobacter sp. ZGTC412 TaxID=2058900 RepID=UPI000CE50C91|nr:extracellular solute-binding protein [Arthrobacter sp. ZGTC412]
MTEFKTAPPSGPRRRMVMTAGAAAIAALMGLTACGGDTGPAQTPAPENSIAVGEYPDYYPADYKDVVAAAEKEGGELTIYSNTDQENWDPVLRDFKKKYPFVTKISANNLDSDEVFQKALSEKATGGSAADIFVSNAAGAWADFAARDGMLADYTSPELGKLPTFAALLPGVVAMSADPQTIAYNTTLLEEKPESLKGLAEQIKANPADFENMIGVRDTTGAFGFTMFYNLTESHPEAWDSLATILSASRPETSSGTLSEKVLAGEYKAGVLVTAAPAFPVVKNSNGLFDIVLPTDGTVVIPRGLGVSADAPHPATAKLFQDFVISEEGQQAVLEGGLSSYREGVESVQFALTYQDVVSKVGEENVIMAPYETVPADKVKAFTDRWQSLLK